MAITKKGMLIGLGILATIGAGLGIFVYFKKKNNSDWKLINLPNGDAKRNKNIIIVRTENV